MPKLKKASLNASHNLLFILTPIIIGFGLILIVVLLEIYSGYKQLNENIESYQEHIKIRMKDEVTSVVAISEFYYNQNKDSLSDEEIIIGIKNILETINSSDIGYFFATDYSGNVITGPGYGINQLEVEDKNGLKIVQELIKLSQNGGGYLEYYLPNIDGLEQAPKTSYVLPFKPYGWYIGAGVLMSEIDTMTQSYKQEILHESIRIIIIISLSIILIMLFLTVINRRFYTQMEKEVNCIKTFLRDSKTKFTKLDTSKFKYKELEEIGRQTCLMVKEHYANLEIIKESKNRFMTIINSLPDVIFILDLEGKFLDYAAGDKSWLIQSDKGYIGQNLSEFLPPDITNECLNKMKTAIETNELQIYEYDLNFDGNITSFEVRFNKFKENQIFSILRNTTELKKAQRDYEYLSYHDQLTSSYNRRFFEEELINIDTNENLPLSIAMIDLNGLKLTNDAFGHQMGDKMLCIVSDVLKSVCENSDFTARIGGDEFVLVCPKTSNKDMKKKIKKIHKKIEQAQDEAIVVSVSVGCDTKTDVSENIKSVLNKAEENMYSKKIIESQSMRNHTVQVIMKTLNEKNEREKIHSERVSAICRKIGEAMKMDSISIKELETAGLLHDIGKISINENILNKEGKLTVAEYNEIKKHPESSYQILKAIDAYAGLADDVLSHHERWDGKGYPRGLKEEEITVVSRIISIADAYEAMTSDRTYRKAMTKEEAVVELKNNAGTQFDERIVKIFEKKVFINL